MVKFVIKKAFNIPLRTHSKYCKNSAAKTKYTRMDMNQTANLMQYICGRLQYNECYLHWEIYCDNIDVAGSEYCYRIKSVNKALYRAIFRLRGPPILFIMINSTAVTVSVLFEGGKIRDM